MSNDSRLVKSLLERYSNKTATPEEIRQLFELIATGNNDDELKEALLMELEGTQLDDDHDQERWDKVWNKIRNENRMWEERGDTKTFGWIGRLAVAASVLFVLGFGGYLLLNKEVPKSQVAVAHDVKPGGNKAYLVLGNGQRISLTDARNGVIANQGNKTIQKTADGMIAYDDSHSIHNNSEIAYNTIETPRGGQYQVVLPDGSKVWLNAASSLKYPAEFTGADRQVELTGEAYFEVAKDKMHPFRVKTDKQTVEVLGTHFDVNAYADEAHFSTTLLEGSVKVTTATAEAVIKPGQQAINADDGLKIAQANIDNVIDWKNGDFYLNRMDFRIAMRKIARWYDVEVVYDVSVPASIESGGWVSRSNNLSTVLRLMERSGLAHFRIEGRKVYVSK